MNRLKKCFKNRFFANFTVTVTIFGGPAPSEKASFESEILELGSENNLKQHGKQVSNFCLKKSLHPSEQLTIFTG